MKPTRKRTKAPWIEEAVFYEIYPQIRSLIVGDKKFNPGIYRVSWDCTDNYGKAVASGPYIYRLTAAKFAKARMMVLVK